MRPSKPFFYILTFLFCGTAVDAQESLPPTPIELMATLDSVEKHEKETGTMFFKSAKLTRVGQGYSFYSVNDRFSIQTVFHPSSEMLHKNIRIKDEQDTIGTVLYAQLERPGGAFVQKALSTPSGDLLAYIRPGESFIYSQGHLADGSIRLKEWISVDKAPSDGVLRYQWRIGSWDLSRPLSFSASADGSVLLSRQPSISGIALDDTAKRRQAMVSVKKALPKVSLEREAAELMPPVYWTKQGQKKRGAWLLKDDRIVLEIHEPSTSYPLLIDPTVAWGQWLGGTSDDNVNAIAVNGDEIYVGGRSYGNTSWEGTFQGNFNGSQEGFVVEITDHATTPSVAWGQWLGGSSIDGIEAVAVNGDEIYVGGDSRGAGAWEATFQGTFVGIDEGFVVEITDGITPTVGWGQWLGGDGGSDVVYALAVNGDEIYAGGMGSGDANWDGAPYSGTLGGDYDGYIAEIMDGITPSVSWGHWVSSFFSTEAVTSVAVNGDEIYAAGGGGNVNGITMQGNHSGGDEGFVIEFNDGTPPTVNWGQWLGGTQNDRVRTIAVNGDEIYAVGYSLGTSSWETAFQGSFGGSMEGFIVELADGATPTFNWAQWLGGSDSDSADAVAINGDEIYVGGYSLNSSSWETTFLGTHSGTEGFIVEMADGSPPTFAWAQWMGGTGTDTISSLAVDANDVFAGGDTNSNSTWEPSFQGTYSSVNEGFLAKIDDDIIVPIDISGTCQAFDQTTNCGDLGEIRVAVDEVLQTAANTIDNNGGSGGSWALSNVDVSPDSIITVFVNNAADMDEAVAVTKVPSSPAAITGMKLFKGHLTIGSSTNQTVTAAELQSYSNDVSGDEDIFHGTGGCQTGGWLCVDKLNQFTSERLYVLSGNSFTATTAMATALLDLRGTYTTSTGNLLLLGTGTNTTCGSTDQMPFCVNGGTFTNTAGWAVSFQNSGASTIAALNYGTNANLVINSGSTQTVQAGILSCSMLSVLAPVDLNANDPTVNIGNGGVYIQSTGTLIASSTATFTNSGLWSNDGNFTDNGGTVTFNSSLAGRTLSGQMTGPNDDFATITFDNANGTWTLAANMDAAAINITNGTFSQGASYNISTDGITVGAGGTWENLGTGDIDLGGDVSNAGIITLDGTQAGCGDADAISITGGGIGRNWSGAGTFVLQDLTISDTATTVRNALSSVVAANNVWWVESDCTLGFACQ